MISMGTSVSLAPSDSLGSVRSLAMRAGVPRRRSPRVECTLAVVRRDSEAVATYAGPVINFLVQCQVEEISDYLRDSLNN
jgi:hypothetical protein